MARQYEGKAQFLIVYVKEAHAAGEWAGSVEGLGYIAEPTTFAERAQVAQQCVADMDISIPCLVDDMENTAARAYKAWPDRLYIINERGRLSYVGAPGPFGFHPNDMEQALRMQLGLPATTSNSRR